MTEKKPPRRIVPRKRAAKKTTKTKDEGLEEATVLVFRNTDGDPVAVPAEVVNEVERAYRCHNQRIQGQSWATIAAVEGYPSPLAAQADVGRYLKEGAALLVEHNLRDSMRLEVARLDALQYALWPAAMRGHVQSAMGCMNIIVNRAKLTGLDPEKLANNADNASTVIIPGDSEGYERALRQAAGDD
jgi:hypothetical protein